MKKRRYYFEGKRVSKGERKIASILQKHKIQFETEKSFKECINGKGNRLRFDFFLNDHNILIEFQGHHHYHPVNKGWRAKKVHDQTVVHDGIKKDFCLTNGIGLLEIKHTEFDDMENIILRVLNYGSV